MIFKRETKKKILLLLLSGVALGLSTSPGAPRRIFRALSRDWKRIERDKLYRNIGNLEKSGVVRYVNKGEWWNVELTLKGKRLANRMKLDEIKINKPKKWDKKWRLVFFDIPESNRVARDALRKKIKELGLVEIQKSIFIHPYFCKNEIDKVVNFFELKKYIVQCETVDIDRNLELKLKKRFKI
ncbi:MAG: hypothetical protein GX765_05325 [Candidatus Moranbacteria bacterium]|jgi:CRISPR-associated endonuclease Cas2|nr:hypothetical protein [Candidatus Moranbacteria bacterium]